MRVIALFLMMLASLPAFAQSNYAELSGTVLDPERAAIVGASIQLTSVSTHGERVGSSNEHGIFQIPGLLPGEYKLTVKAPGFADANQLLRLEVGQQLSLNLTLKLGSVTSDVEVTSNLEMLDKTDASVGEVIEPTSVANLPLNGRMLIDLVLTVPGAHLSHGAQAGDMSPLYWRPGQRSAVSIGGTAPMRTTSFLTAPPTRIRPSIPLT